MESNEGIIDLTSSSDEQEVQEELKIESDDAERLEACIDHKKKIKHQLFISKETRKRSCEELLPPVRLIEEPFYRDASMRLIKLQKLKKETERLSSLFDEAKTEEEIVGLTEQKYKREFIDPEEYMY